MFIVVLIVTLLTAIGIFAVRSTSLVSTAVGYHRQATQTGLLTEYGGRAVTAELGDGAAKTYLDKVGQGTDKCDSNNNLALADLDATLAAEKPACYKLFMSEIAQRVQSLSSNNILEAPTATNGGSLGPAFGAADQSITSEGVFVVEMIEPAESVPTAGSAQGGNNPANAFRDVSLTLTAYGQIRPYDTTASGTDPWCAPQGPSGQSLSASASVSTLRAHVTLKNVPR